MLTVINFATAIFLISHRF